MQSYTFMVITLVIACCNTPAQEATSPPDATAANTVPALAEAADGAAWTLYATVYTYVVPDDQNYAQPTVTFDRDWLHLEARYNYENLETGSAWVGYNFNGGSKLEWEFTPMLGAVFGQLTGIAPGCELSLTWWKLTLYSEGEWVFDTGNSEDSFFYNWSELSLSPVAWFRFGLVGQRTRAYATSVDIQRGLLMGFTHEPWDFNAYVLNLDQGEATWIFSLGVSF
jgi:hypothetical protein